MRSDKYSGERDSDRDTRSYDRWEETNRIFQNRNRENEAQKKQRQKEAAYEEYLAMRREPEANYSPEEDARIYRGKKKQEKIGILEPDERDKKPARRKRKDEKKKKKKKGRHVRRILIVIVLLLAALAAGGTLFVMGLMDRVGSVEIDQSELGINPQTASRLKDYQNIALLGVDARDMSDYKNCRTDAIIILSLDKKNREIRQISVYRDTYLHVNDELGYDKVTNVHAYAGTAATLHTLNENMDLNISETVIVNWKAVADAIDGLGGIEADIRESEIDEMNKYIRDTQKNIGGSKKKIKKPGKQMLNGNQAVTYARIRKDSAEGDYRRNERMKFVVSAAVEKAKRTSVFKLNQIANKVLPEIKTNMSRKSMLSVLLNFVRYDMTGSTGWPFKTEGWINYNGAWCGPPVTLKSNVKELHEKYFGQSGYEPNEAVEEISSEISARTGYY